MVCDAKSLPFEQKTLDANSAKLIKAAKDQGYSAYLQRYANGIRAWKAYSVANCDLLVSGKIYSNPSACLEDAARNRNYIVLDALKLLTTGQ